MDPAGSHILYYYFPPSGTFSALKCWIRPKGFGALHLTLDSLWNQSTRAASLSLRGVGRVGSLMSSSWAAAGAEEQRLLSCLGLGETHLSMETSCRAGQATPMEHPLPGLLWALSLLIAYTLILVLGPVLGAPAEYLFPKLSSLPRTHVPDSP